ncbi:MAG: hypothetical protein EOO29_14315 [Comamonadaceae bacterium]|nr:MAG: hypothetical protein EOO29_14315 [Comamonadaceae bacterium]
MAWLGSPAHAQAPASGTCRAGNRAQFITLDRVYVRDEFRIVYALTGPHALPDATDSNGNGIPDKVEDVATQLVAGKRLFDGAMGLVAPLRQARYAQAESIDVFLLHMAQGNGRAYDEVMNYRLRFDAAPGRCALRIDLLNSHPNQNPTPIHELFHLHQYGYTMFKRRWFLEGTARWSEYALRPGSGPQRALPQTPAALQEQVFGQAYEASLAWNRLAFLLDPLGRLNLPPQLAQLRYVDGSVVVQDDALHGVAFMKAVLESLASLDREVGAERGWRAFHWTEANQRSALHDAPMLRQIQDVVRQWAARASPAHATEIDAFLALTPPPQKDDTDELE